MWLWITTLLTAGQSLTQHNVEIKTNNENTKKQLQQNINFNVKHLAQNKFHHELQYGQDLKSAHREALRDIWAQTNQKNQTLIIMQTLLFSCCFGLLIEGVLPINTSEFIIILYGISLSLTIIFIFISLLCLVKLQSRMTRFNISNPHQIYCCGKEHITFQSYYKEHCRKLKKIAVVLNSIGICLLITTGIILWYARFYFNYQSAIAANIFLTINILSLFIITLIFICIKTDTRVLKLPVESQNEDIDLENGNEQEEFYDARDRIDLT